MFDRLDRLVREKVIFSAWACLVIIYVVKEILLLTPSYPLPRVGVTAMLAEETLWIILQPLGVLVYSVRHWRAMSPSQKLASVSSFWLPVGLLVAVFLKKLSVILSLGINPQLCAKYDIVLEVLWVYFPVAGTLSWYMRRWRHATPGEKWRCQNVFVPVVGTLYLCLLIRICALVLWDLSLAEAGGLVFDEIEEVLWVIYPGLGVWAEHQSRFEHGAHPHRTLAEVDAPPVVAATEAP